MKAFKDIAVIIPAYKPCEKLIEFTKKLFSLGFVNVVIVDDGCDDIYKNIFDKLRETGAVVIEHEVNKGKGEALKTAFSFCLKQYKNLNGVVTADADGQHLPKDVLSVANKMLEKESFLILGVRKFNHNVPLRSKLGNIISQKFFSFILNKNIIDTQTGLRGIPAYMLPNFICLPGKRYEYETIMLLSTKKLNIEIEQIFITTIYDDGNKSSHFNPILDSLRIYVSALKFIMFNRQ